MEELNILNLLIILIAAWIGGSAAKKLGYPAILGELVIGIVLGPASTGYVLKNCGNYKESILPGEKVIYLE